MTRPRRGTPTAIGLGALTLLGAMAAAIEVLKLVNHWLTEPEPLSCEGRLRPVAFYRLDEAGCESWQ